MDTRVSGSPEDAHRILAHGRRGLDVDDGQASLGLTEAEPEPPTPTPRVPPLRIPLTFMPQMCACRDPVEPLICMTSRGRAIRSRDPARGQSAEPRSPAKSGLPPEMTVELGCRNLVTQRMPRRPGPEAAGAP